MLRQQFFILAFPFLVGGSSVWGMFFKEGENTTLTGLQAKRILTRGTNFSYHELYPQTEDEQLKNRRFRCYPQETCMFEQILDEAKLPGTWCSSDSKHTSGWWFIHRFSPLVKDSNGRGVYQVTFSIHEIDTFLEFAEKTAAIASDEEFAAFMEREDSSDTEQEGFEFRRGRNQGLNGASLKLIARHGDDFRWPDSGDENRIFCPILLYPFVDENLALERVPYDESIKGKWIPDLEGWLYSYRFPNIVNENIFAAGKTIKRASRKPIKRKGKKQFQGVLLLVAEVTPDKPRPPPAPDKAEFVSSLKFFPGQNQPLYGRDLKTFWAAGPTFQLLCEGETFRTFHLESREITMIEKVPDGGDPIDGRWSNTIYKK